MSNRTPEEIFELTESDKLMGIMTVKPKDFYQLESVAKTSLLKDLNNLIPFVEIDIYNKINYTCDYLLNSTDSQLNYLETPTSSWYTDSDLLDANNYYDRLFAKHSNISLPFDGLFKLIGDKTNGSFCVPELCNRFSFYVYENIPFLIWYTPKNSKRIQNNKYLLHTLTKVEKYNFTDSNFYLFECLTNVHSAITISDVIYRALSYETLENFLKENKTKEEEQYALLLDKLISVVASSALIYSKSMILVELFIQAEKIFDIKSDFVFLITFVTIQFELIDKFLNETMPLHEVSKKTFFRAT